MAVHIHGSFDLFVPEALGNQERREAQFNQKGSVRVAKVVQADAFQTELGAGVFEKFCQCVFVEGEEQDIVAAWRALRPQTDRPAACRSRG